jgi:uncharacterized protein YutE (UPF0331/DUF86 family)
MTSPSTEAEFLRNLIPQLEEEGYEVFIQPRAPILPTFLSAFQPDLIAIGKGKNLVIEVVHSLSATSKTLQSLAAAIKQNPGWELRVHLATPASEAPLLERQTPQAIAKGIDEVKRLIEAQHFAPALLIAWATFEALVRYLIFDKVAKPQSPGRLVQMLAQDGYVTPSEADALRALAQKRNVLIHGSLQTHVEKTELQTFLDVLERLLAQSAMLSGRMDD